MFVMKYNISKYCRLNILGKNKSIFAFLFRKKVASRFLPRQTNDMNVKN